MEKEVERVQSSDDDEVRTKAEKKLVDGKELARLFQQMTVTHQKVASKGAIKSSMHAVQSKKVRKRCKMKKSPDSKKTPRILLRPSKLSQVVKKDFSTAELRFSEFSADCSRELDTIVKASEEKKTEKATVDASPSTKDDVAVATKSPSKVQKKRKASSCAQQARQECLTADAVNISIDILTDYLEETILLPKKMSYMAELMYT